MEHIFKIPALPPSMNSITKINYTLREVYKSKDARQFEYLCKLYTPTIKDIGIEQPIRVTIQYHGGWFTKKNKIKRKDVQNLDKVLIDAIFDKIGIDDSHIFHISADKVQDSQEFTIVRIETLDKVLRVEEDVCKKVTK